MRRFQRGLIVALVAALIVNLTPLPTQAQQAILLTLYVPPYMRVEIGKVVEEFEAANPTIKVHLNEQDANERWYSPAYASDEDMEKYYESEIKLTNGGDVIFIPWGGRIQIDSVTLGLFLDLSPLALGDPALNSDDYYPAAWQHFQWDGGLWALPTTTNIALMTYDPVKFDEQGLAYPSASWTLDDVINAARKLTVRDGDKVLTKGVDATWDWPSLLASLMQGETLADTTVVPAAPAIEANARFAALYEPWRAFEAEKFMGPDVPDGGGMITFTAPLAISQQWRLMNAPGNRSDAKHTAASLLPGGKAALDVAGVAVSRGTQYPEESYQLARYLALNIDKVHANYAGTLFTRRSHNANLSASLLGNDQLSPDIKAVIEDGLENGLTRADLRYFDYVNGASFTPGAEANAEPIPAREVLRRAQEKATKRQQELQDKRPSIQIEVYKPDLTALPDGEVALKFTMVGPLNQTPNKQQWDALFAEFAANDPEVGRVEFIQGGYSLEDLTTQYDCFTLNWNPTLFGGTNAVLPLDPLMDADPAFDRDDFIGGVLSFAQQDAVTFGYPLTIAPEVLRVDVAQFEKAGVPIPAVGWSMDEFLDALRQLRSTSDSPDKPILVPNMMFIGGSHFHMLLAANGKLPITFSEGTVTIDFTSTEMVEAIRQVLDLAKEKLIAYEGLFPYAGSIFTANAAMYSEHLTLDDSSFRANTGNRDTTYRFVPYPNGALRPASFMVTSAYISAKSRHPDACYRLIGAVAKHPALLNGMPARRSLLQDPALNAVVGADAVALFERFADQLGQPDAYLIPGGYGGTRPIGGYEVESILFRAFDRYVLEGADLEAELKQAEQLATEYLACIAALPAPDYSNQAWYEPYQACAKQVDPTLVR